MLHFVIVLIALVLSGCLKSAGSEQALKDAHKQTMRLFDDVCKNEAKEEIHKTVLADSIYLMPSSKEGNYYGTVLAVDKSPHGLYSAHYQGHLFIFGRIKSLQTLEYDLDEARREVFGDKYATRDIHTLKEGERRKKLKSRYAVKIEDVTRPEHNRLRIIGRTISVLDLQTGEEIAFRKEFVWIDPRERYAGVAYDFCPKDKSEEVSVASFVAKVFRQ